MEEGRPEAPIFVDDELDGEKLFMEWWLQTQRQLQGSGDYDPIEEPEATESLEFVYPDLFQVERFLFSFELMELGDLVKSADAHRLAVVPYAPHEDCEILRKISRSEI